MFTIPKWVGNIFVLNHKKSSKMTFQNMTAREAYVLKHIMNQDTIITLKGRDVIFPLVFSKPSSRGRHQYRDDLTNGEGNSAILFPRHHMVDHIINCGYNSHHI